MIQTKTEERLQYFIDHITYKPEWKIEIPHPLRDRREWHGIPVLLKFKTTDIDTGEEIQLAMQELFHYSHLVDVPDKYFIEWIANFIRKFEEHEFREWFKVDGFCVYDPHPEFKESTLWSAGHGERENDGNEKSQKGNLCIKSSIS